MNGRSDIYTRLKHEHKAVADILRQLLEADTTTAKRQALFTELQHNLSQHSDAENEVFYAPLLTHSDTRDLIRDGQDEHQRIDTLLDELARMNKSDALWGARLHTLKDVIEHHVHEEEEKVFPKAQNIFTAQQAEELGQQFEQAKARHAPTTAARATASARQTGEYVTHEAQRLTEEAKTKGRSMLHDQQHFFASQLGGVAAALHKTAQQLGEEDQRGVAQYVDQAAAGLERFSHTLQERNLSSLVHQVEDFARRQPVAFIGSAALVGFLAARFLKSSAERHHPGYHPSSSPTEGSVGPYTEAMAPSPASVATVGASGSTLPATTPAYGPTAGTADLEKRGTTQPNGGHYHGNV